MEYKKFEIETAKSNIDWTGGKVTGTHNGTISLKQGNITLEDGKLSGGEFIIDTTSIKILDVTDPATNAQFAGHLASADFFASEEYPEAKFVVTSAAPVSEVVYHVTGDLTIRGITHPVAFDIALNKDGDTLTALGNIVVDRTLYGMKFRSGNFFQNLGDTLIYNNFDLNISITANAATEAVAA